MPGTTPTARTMLWMVAWLEGFRDCGTKSHFVFLEISLPTWLSVASVNNVACLVSIMLTSLDSDYL